MSEQRQNKRIIWFAVIVFLMAGAGIGYAAVPQSTVRTTAGGITTYVGHFVNATSGYYVGAVEVIDNARAATFSSIAATSFTGDINMGANDIFNVDSIDAVDINATEYFLSSVNITDRMQGLWDVVLGVFQNNPLAPIHVGDLNVENSVDSQILISRSVNNSIPGNGHAFSDSSNIDRSGSIGYNSYDAAIEFIGSENYNHYAGFQHAANYSSSGTMANMYGFFNGPTVFSGTVQNNYGAYFANPSNTGTIDTNYGIYIADQTSGTTDYGIYVSSQTDGLAAYLGGPVQIADATGLTLSGGGDINMGNGDIILVDDISGKTGGSLVISSLHEAAADGFGIKTTGAAGAYTPTWRFVIQGGAAIAATQWYNTYQLGIVNGGIIGNYNQATTLGVGITTVAITKDFVTLTGDGGSNTISTITGGVTGQTLTMLFVDGLVTITDTDAHGANTVDLSAGFTSADDTILTLIFDGTSWYEISRSVN
jgi:hypothetical protein